jgi:hypothetical protein
MRVVVRVLNSYSGIEKHLYGLLEVDVETLRRKPFVPSLLEGTKDSSVELHSP